MQVLRLSPSMHVLTTAPPSLFPSSPQVCLWDPHRPLPRDDAARVRYVWRRDEIQTSRDEIPLPHRYATFGDVTKSNLLSNYASADVLATFGRVATFISILFGFPLAMLGLRESTASLISTALRSSSTRGGAPAAKGDKGAPTTAPRTLLARALLALTTTHANVLTIGLLAAITAIAITVLDIGLVVGISGSVRIPLIAPDCLRLPLMAPDGI